MMAEWIADRRDDEQQQQWVGDEKLNHSPTMAWASLLFLIRPLFSALESAEQARS